MFSNNCYTEHKGGKKTVLLNQPTAAEIIRRIKDVIDFDLNIMDNTGLILASTDVKRINTFHKGAHFIIEKRLDELIVEEDGIYEGCRKGVNLPISFATQIIGVIGITGQPAEVIKYGRISRK
jgi:carbohydrate diacid regulator